MHSVRQYWRSLWLSVSPARALLEALIAAVIISAWPLVAISQMSEWMLLRFNPSLMLLDGPCCALWCALRLRLYRGPWWRGLLRDTAIGIPLGLLPGVVLYASIASLETQGDAISANAHRFLEQFPLAWMAFMTLALVTLGFVGLRAGVRAWLFWDRLRRTHLRWALTHAHLTLVVLGAGLLALILMLYRTASPGDAISIVPVLFLLTVLTGLALALVLAPSALFSYLFARPTTRRLETLAAATTALRGGDYGVRVPVAGEDEVAQLQANFNAMAEELEQAVHELQVERDTVATLLRSRRELIAAVSHELRTPVATLRGYLESTLTHWDGDREGSWDGAPATTLRHDLGVMERETIHLQALIDDLFTLARAEVGRLELRCAPTDVGALARRAVETMAPLAWRSNRVEVVADVRPGVPDALVDASRVVQVLQNLLHNGVRHTPPGGIVAVAVRAADEAAGGAVVLQVKDTGEGIAADDLPHIWERFYRGERDRERPESGTGLGLALVKELVEAMGGTVRAESVLGAGSCFTIVLPRARSGKVRPPAAPEAVRERATTPLATLTAS